MAYDKVIDSAELDANLTAVADAIRTKGGTTEALSFPDGFVSAVEGIQSGGGDTSNEDAIISGTLSGVYRNDRVTTIPDYGFMNRPNVTEIYMPNMRRAGFGTFQGCRRLKKVDFFDNLTSQSGNNGREMFYDCGFEEFTCNLTKLGRAFIGKNANLHTATLPNLISTGGYLFDQCNSLVNVYVPKLQKVGVWEFRYTAVEILDLPALIEVGASGFLGASKLNKLVLRNTNMCPLKNVNAFDSTPFATSGTGGTVYVPSALIESYQTATNWSTLYAAGTCNFVAIEGSEYE